MVTQKTVRTLEEKQVYFEIINFRFATGIHLSKCQLNLLISLHTCAPIPELPSNISTM